MFSRFSSPRQPFLVLELLLFHLLIPFSHFSVYPPFKNPTLSQINHKSHRTKKFILPKCLRTLFRRRPIFVVRQKLLQLFLVFSFLLNLFPLFFQPFLEYLLLLRTCWLKRRGNFGEKIDINSLKLALTVVSWDELRLSSSFFLISKRRWRFFCSSHFLKASSFSRLLCSSSSSRFFLASGL